MLTQPPKNPETGQQCVTRRLVSRSPSRACRVALDRFRHAAGPRDHLKGHLSPLERWVFDINLVEPPADAAEPCVPCPVYARIA